MSQKNPLKYSAGKINKLYDKLTYYDLYGSSMFVFFIVTLIVIMTILYCKAMNNSQEIKDDWNNQRCDPSVIPFAGFINAPDGTSATEFTSENFSHCVENVMNDSSKELLQPLNSVTEMITDLYTTLQDAINAIRGALAKLRQRIADIVVQIMGKVLNVMTPIQVMFIAFSDIMQKTQAVMATALYTILGIYYSLQAGMGAAVEGIIKILIVMVGVIAALWVIPFTMPVAAISTAIFLTISIPTAIITSIVSKSLHIKSSGIPGLCFDEDTEIKKRDGTMTKIKDVCVGDVLENDSTVTGTMCLSRCTERCTESMYNLNGIIVSGSHVVKFCERWIKVCDHPYADLLLEYDDPYLYCMNTSEKTITIDGTTFTDWDEIYGESLRTLAFEKIDGGLMGETLIELSDGTDAQLKNIVPATMLKSGDVVLGTVEVRLSSKNRVFNYCLGDSVVFVGANINVLKDNGGKIIKKNRFKNKFKTRVKEETVYHLITDTGVFNVMGIKVYDYNSLVDKYSKQMKGKFQIMK